MKKKLGAIQFRRRIRSLTILYIFKNITFFSISRNLLKYNAKILSGFYIQVSKPLMSLFVLFYKFCYYIAVKPLASSSYFSFLILGRRSLQFYRWLHWNLAGSIASYFRWSLRNSDRCHNVCRGEMETDVWKETHKSHIFLLSLKTSICFFTSPFKTHLVYDVILNMCEVCLIIFWKEF